MMRSSRQDLSLIHIYGTVSRYGLIAYGSSLDQIGPIAKDVTDCAAILEAIASYDTKAVSYTHLDVYKRQVYILIPNFLPVDFQWQICLWYRLEIYQSFYQN